jgi:hypothetical protein
LSHVASVYIWPAIITFVISTIAAIGIFVVTLRVVGRTPPIAAGNGSGQDPTQPIFGTSTLLADLEIEPRDSDNLLLSSTPLGGCVLRCRHRFIEFAEKKRKAIENVCPHPDTFV